MRISKTLEIENDINQLEKVVFFVEDFTSQNGIEQKIINQLLIAADELLSNTINYGYPKGMKGRISIELIVTDKEITIVFTDDAIEFDPTKAATPKVSDTDIMNRQIGGLGIYIVKKMMDRFDYMRKNKHNVITITKKF